jgi:hypothetical protein
MFSVHTDARTDISDFLARAAPASSGRPPAFRRMPPYWVLYMYYELCS